MSVMIGVDVGGTKVTAGPVDESGRIVAPTIYEPSVVADTQAFIEGLTATLRRALDAFDSFDPGAMGLACAGTVDAARRLVVKSPNLPLDRVPLAELLAGSLGVEVILENDVNAAVLAETAVGASVGFRHVVMVALGTGVGGGLVLDGRLYRGSGGGAGELGHMIVCGGGEPCNCGARGCLEMYASGRALARYGLERAGSEKDDPAGTLAELVAEGVLDGRRVGDLAHRGYPGALAAAHELAHWLGRGLTGLTNAFNPEIIVVGGGVAELGEIILEPARRYVRDKAMEPNGSGVRNVRAALGNSAGIVGAGLSAWEAYGGMDPLAAARAGGAAEPGTSPPGRA